MPLIGLQRLIAVIDEAELDLRSCVIDQCQLWQLPAKSPRVTVKLCHSIPE